MDPLSTVSKRGFTDRRLLTSISLIYREIVSDEQLTSWSCTEIEYVSFPVSLFSCIKNLCTCVILVQFSFDMIGLIVQYFDRQQRRVFFQQVSQSPCELIGYLCGDTFSLIQYFCSCLPCQTFICVCLIDTRTRGRHTSQPCICTARIIFHSTCCVLFALSLVGYTNLVRSCVCIVVPAKHKTFVLIGLAIVTTDRIVLISTTKRSYTSHHCYYYQT